MGLNLQLLNSRSAIEGYFKIFGLNSFRLYFFLFICIEPRKLDTARLIIIT